MVWLIPWVVQTLKADTALAAIVGGRVFTDADVGGGELHMKSVPVSAIGDDGEILPFAFVAQEGGSPYSAFEYRQLFRVFVYVSAVMDDYTTILARALVATRAALHRVSTPRLDDSVAGTIGYIQAHGGNMTRGYEEALNYAPRGWARFAAKYLI